MSRTVVGNNNNSAGAGIPVCNKIASTVFLAFLFEFNFAAVIAQEAAKQTPKVERDPQRLSVVVELRDTQVPDMVPVPGFAWSTGEIFAVGSAEVQGFKAGQTFLVDVELVNHTSRILSFAETATSCNCAQFAMKEPLVLPDQSARGVARIVCPESASKGRVEITIFSMLNDHRVATVRLTGVLDNNLYIEPHVHLRISDQPGAWRIPVTFTDPVSFSTLSIEKSEELDDIQFVIKQDSSAVFVEAIAMSESFHGDFAQGTLTLVSSTGPRAVTRVLASRVLPVSISPGYARFRKDDETGKWESIILVQISRQVLDSSGEPSRLTFRMGEDSIEADARLLAAGIYKVKLILNEPRENGPIVCDGLFPDGSNYSHSIDLFFLE